MIRLHAKVRPDERVTTGNHQANKVPKIPIPDSIEIEEAHEGGFLLIHVYLREGPFIHTWHETLEEAKEEARVEFSIGEDEWIETVEAP